MKTLKTICVAVVAAVAISAHAQAQSQCLDLADSVAVDSVAINDEPIFDLADVEVMPEYPGGDKAMYEYIVKTLRYPTGEVPPGTVVVSFVIEKDGTLSNIEAVRSPHKALSKEAERVVRSMPQWTPGMHGGQPVRVKYTLPIRFKLSR